jgi:hypothetical protein
MGEVVELRTFRVPGLESDEGRAVFKVGGEAVYAVDVRRGTATLGTEASGPARVAVDFDSPETLEGIIEGRLHPIVAALQSRYPVIEGDRRFGLIILLAVRASAPAFAERRA